MHLALFVSNKSNKSSTFRLYDMIIYDTLSPIIMEVENYPK